jgi:uncharacterized membrane protein
MPLSKTIYVVGLLCLTLCAQNPALPGTFSLVNGLPGGPDELATGINDAGDIIGVLTLAASRSFLNHGGIVTSIAVPGAFATAVSGINNRGDIVGTYMATSSSPSISFLLRDGVYSNVPGAVGINAQGDIVGGSGTHGFILRHNGGLLTFDYPGASRTVANAINARGDIVGNYVTGVVTHGFLLRDGVFTSIDSPDAFGNATFANGINNQGDIVGGFNAAGPVGAYLIHNGVMIEFTANITLPNDSVRGTNALSINDRGEIVGGVQFSSRISEPFLYQPH